MIDPDELAYMRGCQLSLMPERATLVGVTVEDIVGGSREVVTRIPDVPCRIAPMGRQEEGLFGDRLQGVVGYIITLPAGTPLTGVDRIEVGDRRFEVVAVPRRSYETATRAACLELT